MESSVMATEQQLALFDGQLVGLNAYKVKGGELLILYDGEMMEGPMRLGEIMEARARLVCVKVQAGRNADGVLVRTHHLAVEYVEPL